MKVRPRVRGLLAAAAVVAALAASAGTAHADPQPSPQPQPSADDPLVQPPSTFINPNNEGRPTTTDSGGVGMVCQNLLVACD